MHGSPRGLNDATVLIVYIGTHLSQRKPTFYPTIHYKQEYIYP